MNNNGYNFFDMRNRLLFMVVATIVLSFGFGQAQLVQPRGSDGTFDLITWNVKDFPRTGFRTIDTLAVLISDLNIDMVAFQEISDTTAFRDFLGHLPGWDGIYAPDNYPDGTYQKTAVIWRTDRANVTYIEQLFVGSLYQFPRPPIHLYCSVQFGDHQFDFHLIVLHLKAEDTYDDYLRRRAAIIMLKAYLDTHVPSAPDQDWIIVGDYNDDLSDSNSENVFLPILQDTTDYRFLTLPMAGNPYWSSYPFLNLLIDNILITTQANSEYGNGNTITLRLDDEYSNYFSRISDHRPVMAQFMDDATGIDDNPVPRNSEIISIYPNPFNNKTMISFDLPTQANVNLEIYDILGRKIAALIQGVLDQGKHKISLDAGSWKSGVYFVRISTEVTIQSISKFLLLK